ncbi:transposable element Tcb2 transposase [Trichonephila clavipes]|nr:transposable element Tcb2 transposase [Trichonephila clavipes]
MDDNARPHRTLAVEELLEREDITRMDLPAYSSRFKSHRTCVGCFGDVLQHAYIIREHQQLKQMLIEEWGLLPQEMLHQLVLSVRRRCEATIAVREGIYHIKEHLLVVLPVG